MSSTQVLSEADVVVHAPVVDASKLLVRGRNHARAGAIGAALDHLTRAGEAGDGLLDDVQCATLLATSLDCRLARGELPAARALGERLNAYLERPGLAGAIAHYGRGELSVAGNETHVAAAHFERIPHLLDPATDLPDLIPWRTAAALSAVRLGDRAEGTRLAREHVSLAGAAGAAYSTALGLRTLAAVDAHTDRGALLRDALDELAGVRAARLRSQIETDLAGVLLLGGRGDTVEALALLRGAEAYAGEQHLWPLLARVRRLLSRMGAEPRPVLGETLAALTGAEQRVARLAASGITNREIADQLVVTVKAVEWHLSRVYRKLGIRSRGALTTALGLGV